MLELTCVSQVQTVGLDALPRRVFVTWAGAGEAWACPWCRTRRDPCCSTEALAQSL